MSLIPDSLEGFLFRVQWDKFSDLNRFPEFALYEINLFTPKTAAHGQY